MTLLYRRPSTSTTPVSISAMSTASPVGAHWESSPTRRAMLYSDPGSVAGS